MTLNGILEQDEKFRRRLANLKAKVRRRLKKLDTSLDPLERQRLLHDVELLKREINKLRAQEVYRDLVTIGKVISRMASDRDIMDEADWSKAGKA